MPIAGGVYAGRILKGHKPPPAGAAAVKVELIIKPQTARRSASTSAHAAWPRRRGDRMTRTTFHCASRGRRHRVLGAAGGGTAGAGLYAASRSTHRGAGVGAAMTAGPAVRGTCPAHPWEIRRMIVQACRGRRHRGQNYIYNSRARGTG